MSRRPTRRRHAGRRHDGDRREAAGLTRALIKALRGHSLSIALFALFIFCLAGFAFAGWSQHNVTLAAHHHAATDFASYLSSGGFWESLAVNWQAAILQLATLIVFSGFLVERGAAHSRSSLRPGGEERMRQLPRWIYRHSLSLAFFALIIAALAVHACAGEAADNAVRALHGESARSLGAYLISAKFWASTLETWQAEYLVIALYLVLSIFLREEKSAESKPVKASDATTGETNK